ncbi:MAG: sensor histidine kinase [Candidatus Thiodiazotropha sp. (ex Epidulcina cf. delphinae)]|nr:sensor histidine kinase [Candidatus Thiodiazotropha sp. (ex Epidulcina cf. delphinae)]
MSMVKDKSDKEGLPDQSLPQLSFSSLSSSEEQFSALLSLTAKAKLGHPHLLSTITDLLSHTQTSQRRMDSEEEEKKRIAQELHDGLGQLLTTMCLQIQHCLDGCEGDAKHRLLAEDHKESLQALSFMVKQAMTEVRTICSAIRPAILDDLGVIAALSWQCRQIARVCPDIDVITDFDVDESLIPEAYKSVLYRIVQESLNNAVKYSKATRIRVTLLRTHDAIDLSIVDNGLGFDPTDIQGKLGLGLVSMRERAESVSGSLQVDAGVDQGVEICVSLPLEKVVLNG